MRGAGALTIPLHHILRVIIFWLAWLLQFIAAAENGPVVVGTVVGIIHRVVSKARILVIAEIVCSRLTLDEGVERTQSIGSVATVAAANGRQRQDPIVESHAHELVCGIGCIIPVLGGIILCPGPLRRGIRAATPDHFCDQTSRERGQMRHDKVSIRVGRVVGERRRVAEIIHRRGRQHRNKNVVVGEVGVQLLTQREVSAVVGDATVDARVGYSDVLIRQPGKQFL